MVGQFHGLRVQRGIVRRCADTLSLWTFGGMAATKESYDHSSLAVIPRRLALEVNLTVFQ